MINHIYVLQDFREKNSDLVRHDIVLLLKNSSMAFVRELVGKQPFDVRGEGRGRTTKKYIITNCW